MLLAIVDHFLTKAAKNEPSRPCGFKLLNEKHPPPPGKDLHEEPRGEGRKRFPAHEMEGVLFLDRPGK